MTLDEALAGTDALAHLDAAHDAAWNATDADLLELCRRRMAMLLGHEVALDEVPTDELDRLAGRRDADSFSDIELAALAFTEQYVVDVSSMPDDVVDRLRSFVGDEGLVDFVNALLVVEQRMTLELAFEAVL